MPTSHRHLPAPPAEVFAALVDAESYPRWLVGAKQVLEVDDAWPAPGSGFVHRTGGGPAQTKDRTTVTAVDDKHSLDLRVRARPFVEADVHFEVHPDGPGRTALTMRETPQGPFRLLLAPFAPFLKARNDRSLDRLADMMGDGAEPDS